MEHILTQLGQGLMALSTPSYLFLCVAGVGLGMLLGAVPGLSAVVGVALFVPYTYHMEAAAALIFLTSMYVGGMYGGASTAILFRMPGDSDSALMVLDGHPLARSGRAKEALTIAVLAAGTGTLLGALALLFGAPALADFATRLGPVEYFAVGLLGLTLVSGLGGGSSLKGMSAALIGLLLATVGVAPMTGGQRFSFDQGWLQSGFDFVPAILGAFVIGEVLERLARRRGGGRPGEEVAGSAPEGIGQRGEGAGADEGADGGADAQSTIAEGGGKDDDGADETAGGGGGEMDGAAVTSVRTLFRHAWTVLQAAVVGITVGTLPGAGATVASAVGYSSAVRTAKRADRRRFGRGEIRGLIAPQVASSAASVSTLIPLLVLGIPGGAVAAMLIAVFQIHGLQPGPLLFAGSPDLVYTLVATLLLAVPLVVMWGLLESRHAARLLQIPEGVLLPGVTVLAVVGALSANGRLTDVWVMCFFGVLAYVLKRNGYSVAAMVFGLILGPILEPQLLRALLLYETPLAFFSRPVGGPILVVAFLALVAMVWQAVREMGRESGRRG